VALPIKITRGSMSASEINSQLGAVSNASFNFNQTSFRNLTGVSTNDIQLADAYGKPALTVSPAWNYSIYYGNSAINFLMTMVSGSIDYFRCMVFDYTGGVIGAMLKDSGEITNSSTSFTGFSIGQRVFCWVVGFYAGNYGYGTKEIIVENKTIPGTATITVTPNEQYITHSVTPAPAPTSGLPDNIYFAIYDYTGPLTFMSSKYYYTSAAQSHQYLGLVGNHRYYVYTSLTNAAGSYNLGQIAWTSSTTVTAAPGAFASNPIKTGTSASRGFSWGAAPNATLYNVYLWEYLGGASPFGVTYYSGIVFTNSVSGITGIPAGKNLYLYISAENWKGTTTNGSYQTN
jgi:hypothetical protein